MSRIAEVKKSAKNLYKLGRWEECMTYLEEELAEVSEKALELLDLQGDFASYQEKRGNGELTEEFSRVEESRIRKSLLRLITLLKESDLIGSENVSEPGEEVDEDWKARKAYMEDMYGDMSGRQRAQALEEDLNKHIESLQLKDLWTPYDLVNVDREDSYERVKDCWKLKELEGEEFQFYFLCGCPKQMPDRLAERFFLSLVDHLDDQETSVNCPEDSKTGRMKFEYFRLKKSEKLPSVWNTFQGLLEERFQERIPSNFQLKDFYTSGLSDLEDGYILQGFTFKEGEWPDYTGDFFKKVVETFTGSPEASSQGGTAKFLFFFILYFNDFITEEGKLNANQKQVFADIRKLIATYPQKCSLHLGLGPVPYDEAEVWFYELQDTRPNQTHIEKVMDTYAYGLPASDQKAYWRKHEIDMDKMDILQGKIHEQKHNPQIE